MLRSSCSAISRTLLLTGRFAGTIAFISSLDEYLPSNIFANVDPECLGFKFSGVKLDELEFDLNTSSSSDRIASTGGGRGSSTRILSGGTLNCRIP